MITLLSKIFIKDRKNLKDKKVREQYGLLTSAFGIVTNLIISSLKLLIGFLTSTVSIIADGTNNLADASSSIVSLFGFKLSNKPADKDHPFGHQRIEYLSGLIISVIIVVLGVELILESIGKINAPYEENRFTLIIIILSFSILMKIYQMFVNFSIAKKIDSKTLKATGQDSRNDVIATSLVLIGMIIGHYYEINLDGYLGILVGLFVVFSGTKLIFETADPLIGHSPDKQLVCELSEMILSYPSVLGIHDLQMHDYGPNVIFASCHVEVDSKNDILETHDEIDNIEKEVLDKMKINLVIHMDPVVVGDPFQDELKEKVSTLIKSLNLNLSFHDFRIVKGPTHTNLVFDIVVPNECKLSENELNKILVTQIQNIDESYIPHITYDKDYTSTLKN